MPCTKVLFYPVNSAIFLSAEMSEIFEKSKNRQKNSVFGGIGQITYHTVRKYVFFSLRYSVVRFIVLFIFKRSSNNALCGPRETDVRAAKPILWPFA